VIEWGDGDCAGIVGVFGARRADRIAGESRLETDAVREVPRFTTSLTRRGDDMSRQRLLTALWLCLLAGHVAVADDQVTIHGRVQTADGSPLPKNVYVHASSWRQIAPHATSGHSGTLSRLDADGRFSGKMPPGHITVAVKVPGYAAAKAGPIEAEAGETTDEIELVLDRGFTGQVQLLDPDGKPIAGGKLKMYHLFGGPQGNSGTHIDTRELTTDKEGKVTVPNSSGYFWQVEVTAAGFQHERESGTLKAGYVAKLELRRAEPTTGVVVSRKTGKPIAGATLHMVQRRHNNTSTSHGPDDSGKPLLAVTDEAGRFTLDTLRTDSEYSLYVDAEDHAAEVVPEVVSGQEGLKIALGPDRGVRGQIFGPLDSLRRRGRKPTVSVRATFRLRDDGGSYGALIHAEVEDRSFEVKDLPAGEVTIEAGEKAVTVDLKEGMKSVVIDLRK
jgi:hypothetical protein